MELSHSDQNRTQPTLAPWQQRVVEEKKELDERLSKLSVFIGGEQYFQLRADHRSLLTAQKSLMDQLSIVLHNRITLSQRDNDEALAATQARQVGP